MELAVRRRLRVFAWILFLLVSPLLLAYARGYRLTGLAPVSQWLLPDRPAVGAFVVRTVPRGATLSIDGEIVDRRTPAGLGNVPRGFHTIRIEKDGYRPWQKNIESLGGKVQYLLFTRLLPIAIEEDVVRAEVSDVSISPDEQWLLVHEGQVLRRIPTRTADARTDSFVRVPKLSGRALLASWAPDGSAVAIEAPGDALAHEFLGVLNFETGRFLQSLPARARFVGWSAHGKSAALFLDTTGRLFRQPTGGPAVELAHGVAAATVHPRGILMARTSPSELPRSLELLSEQGTFEHVAVALPETPSTLGVSQTGAVAALGERTGTLFLLSVGSTKWQEVAKSRHGFTWSPDGDKLLYQESPFDAWALNVSEERSVLPKDKPELLIRLSTPVKELRWFPDSQHVLFFEQDILELVEIDPRDGHRIETLASTNRGTTRVMPAENGDTIYVIARRGDRDALVRLSLRTPADR